MLSIDYHQCHSLLRYLIEGASGLFTGSYYKDKMMANKLGGELGEIAFLLEQVLKLIILIKCSHIKQPPLHLQRALTVQHLNSLKLLS